MFRKCNVCTWGVGCGLRRAELIADCIGSGFFRAIDTAKDVTQ
jgi:hypothetical protein